MNPIRTTIHRTERDQVILELVFHGDQWQSDSEIRKAIAGAITPSTPAGILLDLSSFRYHGGDYVSGFAEAFFDRGHARARPACFVGAPRGVKTLFEMIDLAGALGVRHFRERAQALDYLKTRLGDRADRT